MTAAPRAWVGAAALAAATLPACGDGPPPQRGFGSRQVVQLRDPSFSFMGARGDVVLYAVGTDPTTSYLSVDLRTGAVATHDSMYSDIPAPEYTFPADPNARFHCSYGADDTGDSAFRIDDAQTDTRTTITGGSNASRCPTDGDPTLMIWRADDTGHLKLWTGPYDDLQMLAIDLVIKQVLGSFSDAGTSLDVLASRSSQPDALGIYSLDLTTFAVGEVVAPTLAGGAWASGTAAAGVSDSASLFADPNSYWDGVFPIGDHYGYWRAMADGSVRLFVGPFASGPAREVALFDRDPSAVTDGYLRATTGDYLGPAASGIAIWQRWHGNCAGTGCGYSDLLIWDDARQRLLTCPSAFTSTAVGVLSDGHDRLAAFVLQNPVDTSATPSLPTGPLLTIDLTNSAGGSTACTTLVAADVNVAGFAPDGSSLFWLVQQPYPATTAQLTLAAPDGGAPRVIGADRIEGPPHEPHFVGPSQLEVDIDADLVWIDTHDDPIATHGIVNRTRGGAIDRGRWLIIGYDSSQQDGTADLGVVNRDHGDKRLISPDVAAFFSPDIPSYVSGLVLPAPRTASDPLRVVYLVRGRNPSPQDGVWVASVYPSDTP
jgi:hypothetical protein